MRHVESTLRKINRDEPVLFTSVLRYVSYCCFTHLSQPGVNREIKHDFPFINIRNVPREVLITEGEARGFQRFHRDLANVNE